MRISLFSFRGNGETASHSGDKYSSTQEWLSLLCISCSVWYRLQVLISAIRTGVEWHLTELSLTLLRTGTFWWSSVPLSLFLFLSLKISFFPPNLTFKFLYFLHIWDSSPFMHMWFANIFTFSLQLGGFCCCGFWFDFHFLEKSLPAYLWLA